MKKQLLLLIALIFSTILSAQVPTITSFAPTSGPIGTSVTITGTNFDATPANNIVFFGATMATVSTATATELTVTVPVGATYQPITVLVNGLVAYSATPFTVTFGGAGIDATSFATKVDYTAGAFPRSVAIGDLDGDGKADLAVSNQFSNTVSVFRNTSTSGTIDATSFATKVDYTTGSNPIFVSIGDLDGDGKADLAVTNQFSNTVSVFRNTSTSGTLDATSFAAKVDYTTGSTPFSVSIGDLDGDGKADLAVSNQFSNTVSVFRNTSTSGTIDATSFATKVDYTTGAVPVSVSIGDLDGDGKADLAVTNQNSSTVSVFRNTSTSGTIDATSFAAKVDYTTGTTPFSVSIGDLDGDGKADLAVSNQSSNTVSVFRNTSTSGTIDATSFATKVDYTTGAVPVSVSIGDLDGDGKADMAVANLNGSSVSLLRNTSTNGTIDITSFATKVDYTTGSGPRLVSIGDLDGDGKAELAVANQSSNTVSVLRNTIFPPSTETDITAFSFAEQTGAATVDATNHTVDIEVAFGSDLTALVATYTLSDGATAEVNAATQISGTTPNDFIGLVTYTITAEDGTTTQDWVVTVTVSEAILMSNGSATTCDVVFKDSGGDANYADNEDFTYTISPETATDKIKISFSSFNLESCCDQLSVYDGPTTGSPLIATLTGTSLPADIIASGSGGELTFNFTSDGSVTRTGWEANITCAESTDITAFSFAEQTGAATIDATNHTVDIDVAFGTNITSLISTFSLISGASAEVSSVAQVSGVTANDFTSPVIYTITAVDGITTQDWVVTVSISNQVIIMTNGSATTCDATFKDSGGDANYADNEDFTYTFSPETATDKIMVSFSSFHVDDFFDNLFVYDGPDTNSPLIATLTGSDIPEDITASGPGGELTFNFVSSTIFTQAGWEADITCVTLPPSTETDITAFSFVEQVSDAVIDADNYTIAIDVALGSDLTALVATYTLSDGATAGVNATAQISGTTSNDFTSPVTYTITAEDGTATQDWVVSVSDPVLISNGSTTTCDAIFKDSGGDGAYQNNEDFTYTFSPENSADKIKVTFTSFELEPGFDNLRVYDGPTIESPLIATLTGSELPSFIVATEAGGELTFKFTSDASATFPGWEATISCVAALSTATDITDFSFAEQSGSVVIDTENHTVGIGVSTGTDLNALVSSFTLSSGATAQVSGEPQVSGSTVNNFSFPIIYTVTAENGFTSQNWTVSVSIGPVGLGDDLRSIDVSVYPNPVSHQLQIDKGANSELSIQLVDLSGKLMFSETTKDEVTTIDMRALNPGIFLLKLSNGNTEVIQRILKN